MSKFIYRLHGVGPLRLSGTVLGFQGARAAGVIITTLMKRHSGFQSLYVIGNFPQWKICRRSWVYVIHDEAQAHSVQVGKNEQLRGVQHKPANFY